MLKGNLVASRQNRFPSIYSYYHNNILLQLVIPKIVGLKEENPTTIVEKILKKNSLHSKIG